MSLRTAILSSINNLLSIIETVINSTLQDLHSHKQSASETTNMIPKAHSFTRSTGVLVGAAGVATASPLLFFIPGAEERLAAQAAKWGPRWNRGFARLHPAVQHGAGRVEPHVKKGVQFIEPPLKKAAM